VDNDLEQFVRDLNGDIHDRAVGDATSLDDAFGELMLEYLSDAGVVENASVAKFEERIGRGIGRVGGYGINEEEDTLDLFITVFLDAGQPTRLPPDEVRKAIEQAVRYGENALKGLHTTMPASSDAYSMTARISELADQIDRIRIFVMTDGTSGLAGSKIPNRKITGKTWSFDIWDSERLSRLLQSGAPQAEVDIDLETIWSTPLPCVTMPANVTEYQSHLAIVPGELLFRLYDTYGARLLERNVRSFLQAKGKVNRGIRDTLKNEPARFMAYNNGISVTAQAVELKQLPDGRPAIARIKGLQIVNGGQTTASIHRAGKTDKADLSDVFVPAKISVVPLELLDSLAPRIAKFANTQNPVQMADFSANDPFHIELERLSKAIWMPGEQSKWFYERARGQYQVAQATEGTTSARVRRFKERTPPSRRFTKIDVAKYLNSWDQLPHSVSQGGQTNFVLFMQRLREIHARGWLPDDAFYRNLIAKAILFNTTAKIVRSEGFPAYRANIVTYLVAALALKSGGQLDLKQLWDNQCASAALEALLRNWAHPVAEALITSAAGRNITQWAKKAECWKAVMSTPLPLPEPMPAELHATVIEPKGWGIKPVEVRVALDPDELDAIAACRGTEVADWIRILDWGQRTAALDPAQRQTASALASLAASGWLREPNAKQAREGRQIINLARELGAFSEVSPA
jgi:hypothetical protein